MANSWMNATATVGLLALGGPSIRRDRAARPFPDRPPSETAVTKAVRTKQIESDFPRLARSIPRGSSRGSAHRPGRPPHYEVERKRLDARRGRFAHERLGQQRGAPPAALAQRRPGRGPADGGRDLDV